jgi:hypothetical protein
MNRNDMYSLIKETHDSLFAISNSKGEEYASNDTDRLANFKRLAQELDIDARAVLLVYLTKHLDSIQTYCKDVNGGNPRNLSEPIEGRIDDAILYLILLKGLIRDAGAAERAGISSIIGNPMAITGGFRPAARGPRFNGDSGLVVRLYGNERMGGSEAAQGGDPPVPYHPI